MVVPTPQAARRNALVLAAAHVAGVHRVFTIGGAQAVAALAYGTATVPRVDKITGPGNAYVASAKRRVFGQVGIDMIAGPSEILVLADGSTPPDWVAMDLFSQAEHDELAQSILLCPDAAYIDAVQAAIDRLLPAHAAPRRHPRLARRPRRADPHAHRWKRPARSATASRPSTWRSARATRSRWEPLLRHAGAIFLGAFTSESLGDYCAGPNHVLPTSGTARFSSPLGVYDFQKRSSLIEVSEAGAQVLGPIAAELAYGEGLQAHARAAEMRLSPRRRRPRRRCRRVQRASGHSRQRRGADEAGGGARPAPVRRRRWCARWRRPPTSPPAGRWACTGGDQPVGFLLLYDARLDKDEPADAAVRLAPDGRCAPPAPGPRPRRPCAG